MLLSQGRLKQGSGSRVKLSDPASSRILSIHLPHGKSSREVRGERLEDLRGFLAPQAERHTERRASCGSGTEEGCCDNDSGRGAGAGSAEDQ